MKPVALAALAALSLAAPTAAWSAHGAHAPSPAAATAPAQGVGVIKAINARAGTITIQHAPIPALKWPAMTMPFKIAPALAQGMKGGQQVTFSVRVANGAAEIVAIKPN